MFSFYVYSHSTTLFIALHIRSLVIVLVADFRPPQSTRRLTQIYGWLLLGNGFPSCNSSERVLLATDDITICGGVLLLLQLSLKMKLAFVEIFRRVEWYDDVEGIVGTRSEDLLPSSSFRLISSAVVAAPKAPLMMGSFYWLLLLSLTQMISYWTSSSTSSFLCLG